MAGKQYNRGFEPKVINVRCPSCGKVGAFHGVHNVIDSAFFEEQQRGNQVVGVPFIYGLRICPNLECGEPLFVVLGENYVVKTVFPNERLDFEPTGIPSKILATFEEALSCHSVSSFRAAAIMVRRTLEEICADRGAVGDNLKQRVAALGAKIVVPKELLEAADELRLLGNDAAHLEAQIYDDVGREEVEAAIELAKEMLKAVYQLSGLVNRLKALKKN
jgi:hypothetical protein